MKTIEYYSTLRSLFSEFVALRRSCGADFTAQAGLLGQFDAFLKARRARRVTARHIGAFLGEKEHLTARGKDNLCSVIWQALTHARLHGGPVDPLPPRPACPPGTARPPYVLSDDELDRLLTCTKALRARPWQRILPVTYSALFGLLCTTGIRIGEALALDVRDIDRIQGVLSIRAGKFSKARLVPLAPSTVQGLTTYLARRRRFGLSNSPETPLFVSCSRSRLSHPAVDRIFRGVIKAAGIVDAAGRRPRIHDLRHTFAIRTVIAWHKQGREANRLLALLSTYMGHVGVQSTQVYLRPTRALLEAVARRFESQCAPRARRRSGRRA